MNNNRIENLEEKISFYKSKIGYFNNYISKTELKIKNFDSDHEIITNVEIKEVSSQGINDYVFIIVVLSILAILINVIDNNSVLAFTASICLLFLSAAGVKVIFKRRYISKIRKLNLDDRKKFLNEIFNERIKKCRFGIEMSKNSIIECEQDMEKLRKERQYS